MIVSVLLPICFATWALILATAPSLLLGLLLAGLLHAFIPRSTIERHLKKPGLKSVALASAAGVPLPLCSCSVIPVAVELRRAGASKGATSSFLISTPEIGVDSFLLSFSLLGTPLAVARAIAAFFTAFAVGVGTDFLDRDPETANAHNGAAKLGSCCAHDKHSAIPATNHVAKSILARVHEAITYGFGPQLDDLAPLLTVGLLISALIEALAPDGALLGLGQMPIVAMLVVYLFSLPTYVCAAASTPLAAVLLAKGLPVGACFVFLLAGPASNAATMLAVRQELGTKAVALYLSGVSVCTLAFGLIVQYTSYFQFPAEMLKLRVHDHANPIDQIAGVILSLLLLQSLARSLRDRSRTDAVTPLGN